ncbi:MAG: response regulator transcription factor [Chloroflexota bacterium]|nr:response regulator transcription factor [Chloroflexota bacterium]
MAAGATVLESGSRVTVGTILLVDDEAIVREVVERYLRQEGFRVDLAADGPEALRRFAAARPDLVVLDLMLPGVDGLEVCRRIRAQSNVPIVMLTAKGDETDTVIGLGVGADDYVAKPFSPRELVARIKAVLRRSEAQPTSEDDPLRFGAIVIRPDRRQVEVDGQAVDLTAREFDLLLFLAAHPGQVFSREELLDKVWDWAYASDGGTVTVHVRRLRQKIEALPERPRYIKTVWGAGYKFES